MSITLNCDMLRAEVAAAAKRAFECVRQLHPEEEFYGFAVCPDGDVSNFFLAANSEEGLRRKAEYYSEKYGWSLDGLISELRWSVGDWDFCDLPAEKANELLAGWNLCDDLDDEGYMQTRNTVLDTMVQSLKDLDREGFFGTGELRDKMTLLVSIDDGDREEILRLARALNPEPAFRRFAEPA